MKKVPPPTHDEHTILLDIPLVQDVWLHRHHALKRSPYIAVHIVCCDPR